MKKYYGKKRWVPKRCPACFNESYRRQVFDMKALTELLGAWKVGIDKYQPGFEGIDRWYGSCPKCTIRENLTQSSLLWDSIKKRTNQVSGNIREVRFKFTEPVGLQVELKKDDQD